MNGTTKKTQFLWCFKGLKHQCCILLLETEYISFCCRNSKTCSHGNINTTANQNISSNVTDQNQTTGSASINQTAQLTNTTIQPDNQDVKEQTLKINSPFFLFPTCEECPSIVNATSVLDFIEIRGRPNDSLFHTVPMFTTSVRPFTRSTNDTSMKLFLCYYQPDNNADVIEITPSGSVKLNYHFQFEFRVFIRSGGVRVSSGHDSEMKIKAKMVSPNCSKSWDLELKNGTVLITGKHCHPTPAAVLTVSAQTHAGLALTAKTSIDFTPDYNVLILLSHRFKSVCDDLNQSLKKVSVTAYGGLQIQVRCPKGNIFSNITSMFTRDKSKPGRVHQIIAAEQKDNMATIRAFGETVGVPVFILDVISATRKHGTSDQERYLSLPSSNSFPAFLASHFPTSQTHPGVVIFRQLNSVSFSEYFAIHRVGVRVIRDVIVGDDVALDDVMAMKDFPRCSVFMFVGESEVEQLLRLALEVKVSPLEG